MTPKQRATDLARALREAAARQEPLARAAIELLELTAENLKDSLVEAEGPDVPRLQGGIRTLHKLHRELTTQPPTMTQEQ